MTADIQGGVEPLKPPSPTMILALGPGNGELKDLPLCCEGGMFTGPAVYRSVYSCCGVRSVSVMLHSRQRPAWPPSTPSSGIYILSISIFCDILWPLDTENIRSRNPIHGWAFSSPRFSPSNQLDVCKSPLQALGSWKEGKLYWWEQCLSQIEDCLVKLP